MFNRIIKFLIDKRREYNIKTTLEIERKYFEIRGAVIKFYEDKDITDNTVNIPAFQRADQTLKEVIKTPADINFYYNKLKKYKVAA